jgi:hypothetical protein
MLADMSMNEALMRIVREWKKLGGSPVKAVAKGEDEYDDVVEEEGGNKPCRLVADQAYNLFDGPSECDEPVMLTQS